MANDEDASAKAQKLVKQLHDATASAEDLAKTVADGIRKERYAGQPYKPAHHTRKAKPKRTVRKKR